MHQGSAHILTENLMEMRTDYAKLETVISPKNDPNIVSG